MNLVTRRRIEVLEPLIGQGRLCAGADRGARIEYRVDRTRTVMSDRAGSNQHLEQERWSGIAWMIDGAVSWGVAGVVLELENGDRWPVTIVDGNDQRLVLSALV